MERSAKTRVLINAINDGWTVKKIDSSNKFELSKGYSDNGSSKTTIINVIACDYEDIKNAENKNRIRRSVSEPVSKIKTATNQ